MWTQPRSMPCDRRFHRSHKQSSKWWVCFHSMLSKPSLQIQPQPLEPRMWPPGLARKKRIGSTNAISTHQIPIIREKQKKRFIDWLLSSEARREREIEEDEHESSKIWVRKRAKVVGDRVLDHDDETRNT